MEKTFNLYEKKRSIFAQANEIKDKAAEEGRQLTADELARFEAAYKDMESIDKQIELEQRVAGLGGNDPFFGKETKTDKPADDGKSWGKAFDKWLRNGVEDLTAEERSALKIGISSGKSSIVIDMDGVAKRAFTPNVEKRAANSVLTNETYVQPIGLAEQFGMTMKAIGPWMEACTRMNTPKGNTMYLPYFDDAGNDGAKEAEGTDAIASSTDLDAARMQLDSYWYSSTGLYIGWSELRDAEYPINDFIIQPLMNRLMRAISAAGTTGSGSSLPEGITAPSSAMKEAYVSKATVPDMDDFVEILNLVNYAYHTGPSSGWMFNSNTMFRLASAVKSATYNNEPLWQPSLSAGIPDKLFGYPFWINNSMVSQTAAPGNFALFGDFSKFILRFAGPLIVSRLEERYAEKGQVGFLISQYFDSVWSLPVTSTYTPVAKWRSITT